VRRFRRRQIAWGLALGAVPASILGLWVAIHHVPWLGPLLADSARAVVGPAAVATVEDVAYDMQDRWNRFWRADEAPRAYWAVPSSSASVPPSSAPSASPPAPPLFRPLDVGPVFASSYADGDGVWVPMVEADCGEQPCMFKTLLHPDRVRGWASVAVAAIDTKVTRLHLVAGVEEPRATQREARDLARPGLIPPSAHDGLLAAFNGGFKTEHGSLGMQIDGVTFVLPQRWGCTVARLRDDRLSIASWPKMQDRLAGARWWRQAPSCLVEEGKFAAGVHAEENINWGRAISGETIIRRSAMGIDERGEILFVGISDATSAGAIARAMHHAGAHTVAQLDVNWSFPKFLVYERSGGGLTAKPICPGFQFSEKDYVEKASARDFFYVTKVVDR
jgi:hypothetical protein